MSDVIEMAGRAHRPWCTDHVTDPDEPGWRGECTCTVRPAAGLLVTVTQELGHAAPVFAVTVTDTEAAEALTLAETRTLADVLTELAAVVGSSATLRD